MIGDTRSHSRWRAAIKLFGGDSPGETPSPRHSSSNDGALPFRLRPRLLSESEGQLFQVLDDALGDIAIICVKTRVSDVISVDGGSEGIDAAARIDRKKIDFLLCRRETFEPCIAVQVEHWIPSEEKYEPRDVFIDRALVGARLAVVHIRSDRIPLPDRLRERLAPMFFNRTRIDPAEPRR